METVWLIPTDFGEAVRHKEDVESETDEHVRFKKECHISIFREQFFRKELGTTVYNLTDLPDASRSETEISNVCGFVAGFSSLFEAHPAWRTVRSTLGSFKEVRRLLCASLASLTSPAGVLSPWREPVVSSWQTDFQGGHMPQGRASYGAASAVFARGPQPQGLSHHRHRIHAPQCVCAYRMSVGGDAVSVFVVSGDAQA